MRAAGLWVLLLALVSWSIVAVEAMLMRQADLMAIATALLFTALLAAWPFLAGVRVGSEGVRVLRLCHQCGAAEVLGIPFCIHCGAFPRPVPQPA